MPVRCPFAQWRPLASAQSEPPMRAHDIVCLHTMAGYLVSTDGLFRLGGWSGTESHFGVGGKWGPDVGGLDGALYQWQDLLFQADANLEGNPRVISVETADNATTPIEPWTPAQVDTIVKLLDWLCSREAHAQCPTGWLCRQVGIPRVLLDDSCPSRRGIGYHRLGIAHSTGDPNAPGGPWLRPGCERWSGSAGKVCPDDARIAQLKSVVVPRVAARQLEDDMTPGQAAQLNNVEALCKRLIASNTRIENKPLRPTVAAIVAADDIDVDALVADITAGLRAELLAVVGDAVRAAVPSDLADDVIDALTARLNVAAEELG